MSLHGAGAQVKFSTKEERIVDRKLNSARTDSESNPRRLLRDYMYYIGLDLWLEVC